MEAPSLADESHDMPLEEEPGVKLKSENSVVAQDTDEDLSSADQQHLQLSQALAVQPQAHLQQLTHPLPQPQLQHQQQHQMQNAVPQSDPENLQQQLLPNPQFHLQSQSQEQSQFQPQPHQHQHPAVTNLPGININPQSITVPLGQTNFVSQNPQNVNYYTPAQQMPSSGGMSTGYYNQFPHLQYNSLGQVRNTTDNGAPRCEISDKNCWQPQVLPPGASAVGPVWYPTYREAAFPGMAPFGHPYPFTPYIQPQGTYSGADPQWMPSEQADCFINNKIPFIETDKTNKTDRGTGTEKCESDIICLTDMHTIEVNIVGSVISTKTLEMYFENRRRSGGSGKLVLKDGVILVRYNNSQDVTEVLNREHVIDGQTLEIKEHKPSLVYRNRFLVSNLNPETTSDGLQSFLEAKSRCCVTDIQFCDIQGTALVTFTEDKYPDKTALQIACEGKPVDGNILQISEVNVSDRIIVHGISRKTSDDTIIFYFESMRSGNTEGETVEVSFYRTDGYCIVRFSSHKVAARVLSRTHDIDGVRLSAALDLDCLGVRSGQSPFWFYQPVSVKVAVHKMKFWFLQQSPTVVSMLEKELLNLHTELTLTADDTATLKCIVDTDSKDTFRSAKKWEEDVTNSFSELISLIAVENIQLMSEVCKDILEEIDPERVSQSDNVKVFRSDCGSVLTVVGLAEKVAEVCREMKSKIKINEDRFNRKKEDITESVTTLKPIQIRLLKKTGFHFDVMGQFSDLNVKLKLKQNAVVFSGQRDMVDRAQLQMFKKINTFSSCTVNVSRDQLKFLKQKEVTCHLENMMKGKQITAVLHVTDESGGFDIMTESDEDNLAAAELVKKETVKDTVFLTTENVAVLSTLEWNSFVGDIQTSLGNLTWISSNIERKMVTIISIPTLAAQVKERVQDVVEMNTILTEMIPLPIPIYRFLLKHAENKMSKIATKLSNLKVKLQYKATAPQIILSGCREGISKAKTELNILAESIRRREYILKKSWMSKLMNSDTGKRLAEDTENSERVTVDTDAKTDTVGISLAKDGSKQTPGLTVIASCNRLGGQVHVARGDLTQVEVDVIVNAANTKLDHLGGLAGAVSKQGGPAISRESSDYISKHGPVPVGGAASTGPGNLPCRMIVHAVGPEWTDGNQGEENLLKSAILNSLQIADNAGFRSIAIPAVSSGIYQYPVDLATKHITETVKQYFNQQRKVYNLKDIYLTDFKGMHVDSFLKALRDVYGDSAVRVHDTADIDQFNRRTKVSPIPEVSTPKSGCASESISKPVNVRLVFGEIAKQEVDVIVNSISPDLNLRKGAVSKSILQYGGQSIEGELQKSYQGDLQAGVVAVSSGGLLQCGQIYHVCLSQARKNEEGNYQILETAVRTCLTKACVSGKRSIAFPALGTGVLKYPPERVAQTLYTTVREFRSHSTSLTDVRFVIYPDDTHVRMAFERYISMSEITGSSRGHPAVSSSHSLRSLTAAPPSHRKSISVKITRGEIAKHEADVIVNSISKDVNLEMGAVSKSILHNGGASIKDDLHQHHLKGVDYGDVVFSTGGCLKCKRVYHVCLPPKQNQSISMELKKVVETCLQQASDSGYRSIAFPALGTGALNYPVAEVAYTMFRTITEFEPWNRSLSEVHIVIYPADAAVFKAFTDRQRGSEEDNHHFIQEVSMVSTGSFFADEGEDLSHSPSVSLTFYSDDERCIDKGIQTLESKCDRHIHYKKMDDPGIGKISTMQIKLIQQKHRSVDIKLDKSLGIMEMRGLQADVAEAALDITSRIRTIEKDEGETKVASLLTRSVQWCYIDKTSGKEVLTEFEKKANAEIENAFESKKTRCSLQIMYTTVSVDFTSMTATFNRKKKNECSILRKDRIKEASTFDLPKRWKTMKDEDDVIIVSLAEDDKEYDEISSYFQQNIGTSVKILKIERIQNRLLYQQYQAKKKQMEKRNPSLVKSEQYLWHGTSSDAIDSINNHGFNRSYCGKNGTVYGDGVYFAVEAEYSADKTYSTPDKKKRKFMYLAHVLTGDYTKGYKGLRVPPKKPGLSDHELYESVVDDTAKPTLFVIFNDTQAYPEYLITFSL